MPTLPTQTTPYYGGGQVPNPANVILVNGAPSIHHMEEKLGTLAVQNDTGSIYCLSSKVGGNATWTALGAGSSDVNTLSGNSGGSIAPVGGNLSLSGGTLANFVGSGSTLTLTPKANGYSTTPYVVGPIDQAGYQTIQSALDAANADGGGMVWVQPGTYTENLTFYSGIQLSTPSEQTVTIVGTHTPPNTGTLNLDRMTLRSDTNIFSSASAGTCSIIMEDCSVAVTNGYTFNLPNWTGSIACFNIGPFGTNDGFVNNTAGAPFFCYAAGFGNGTANPMIVSGLTVFDGANVGCPINFVTGSTIAIDSSTLNGTVNFLNNSTGSINHSRINTGASPASVMSSSASVSIENSIVTSSNNPAIDGAGSGVLTFGNVDFTSNTLAAATLTLGAANVSKSGNLEALGNVVCSAAGKGLRVKSGSNARIGVGAVLIGGTLVVSNTSVTANTVVMVSITALGTVAAPKAMYVTKSAGVGFTVTSADATDTSTFDWYLVEAV